MRILGNFSNVPQEKKEEVFVNARFNGCDNSIHPFAIGGSDISIILGINPWTSPRELLEIKTKKIVTESNAAMECGKKFEDHARLAFERLTGFKTRPCNIQVAHDIYPHVVYNADGFVEINGRVGLIEIKTTSADNINVIKSWKKGDIPPYYKAQGTYGLGIYDLDFIVYILCYGLRDENIAYVIKSRDKDLEEDLYAIAENFISESALGVVPNIQGSSYTRVLELLKNEVNIVEKAVSLPLDEEITDTVNLAVKKFNEAASINSKAKKLVEEADEKKKEAAVLLAPIFEAYGSKIAFNKSVIEFRVSKREGINKELLVNKYNDIYKECLNETQVKSLVIRKAKQGEMAYD